MSKIRSMLEGIFGGRILAAVIIPIVVMAALYGGRMVWYLLLLAIITVSTWEATEIAKNRLGTKIFYGALKWQLLSALLIFAVAILSWQAIYEDGGPQICFQVIWAIWFFDTFALVGGKMSMTVFGGTHKIYPKISPGKSWEGYLVGIAFGLVAIWLSGEFLQAMGQPASIVLGAGWNWLLIVAALSFGHFGDFVESAFKRWGGVKDSSRIFGEHGGMLDRFDAFVFVGVAILFFRVVGWL